jgi:hypothetical protein
MALALTIFDVLWVCMFLSCLTGACYSVLRSAEHALEKRTRSTSNRGIYGH